MTKMAAVLEHTSEVMTSKIHDTSYLALKELLSSPTWRYSHLHTLRKHTASLPQIVMTGCGEQKETLEIAGMATLS